MEKEKTGTCLRAVAIGEIRVNGATAASFPMELPRRETRSLERDLREHPEMFRTCRMVYR